LKKEGKPTKFLPEIHLGDRHRQIAETIAGEIAGYIETLGKVIAAGIKTGELRLLSPRETWLLCLA